MSDKNEGKKRCKAKGELDTVQGQEPVLEIEFSNAQGNDESEKPRAARCFPAGRNMKTKKVLIVSNPEDEHTVRVTEHLVRLGVSPILYYPENFGRAMFFASRQGVNNQESIIISNLQEEIDFGDIDSVWYRRPRLVSLESESLDSEGLAFARDEWKSALK